MMKVTRLKPHLPYSGWPLQSVVLSLILAVGTASMQVISFINLKVILLSSGLPAFIEDESKATMIALLAPIASITIKLLVLAFEYPETKRLYQKILFITTALCILVWVFLISQTFDGMGGEIVLDDLLDSAETGDGGAYVMVQLLCEILMGASLFTGWQSLHDRYHPDDTDPNIHQLDKKIARYEGRAAQASERVAEARRKAEKLRTQRQVFINQQLESLALLKSRQDHLNNFFGDK